jgi:hypothetical protein
MADVTGFVKKYLAYLFILLGLVWVGVIVSGAANILLWPALTSILSGVLLLVRPEGNFSTALSRASALYGVLLAGYQAYVAIPLLGSVFSTFAASSFASFGVVTVVYLALLYASLSATGDESRPSPRS